MRSIARLCAVDATAATWSAATAVRAALIEAGFEVEKKRGFARKREMLCARIDKRRVRDRGAYAPTERRAFVIGAGIAGAAVCERLCARGWSVTLLERQTAQAKDDLQAGVFHPVLTPDDSLFARMTRAGFLHALVRWRALETAGTIRSGTNAACCSLRGTKPKRTRSVRRSPRRRRRRVREIHDPRGSERACGSSSRRGRPVVPYQRLDEAGIADRAQLAAAGARLETRFGCEVARIAFEGGAWRAFDSADKLLAEAPFAVLANAADAVRLAPSQRERASGACAAS
jgi:tRNA 5-methylaminomethyl-2-thiouridine biosynthesis bifunctional protein